MINVSCQATVLKTRQLQNRLTSLGFCLQKQGFASFRQLTIGSDFAIFFSIKGNSHPFTFHYDTLVMLSPNLGQRVLRKSEKLGRMTMVFSAQDSQDDFRSTP
jgi:hypothetical protein